jgi:hypothetical protein
MRLTVVALVAWVLLCALLAGIIAPKEVNTGFKDSTSVLAFISLSAVAIERCIEAFFSVLSGKLGEWWPLKVVRDEFDTFEKQTNDVLNPIVDETIKGLTAAINAGDKTADELARIQGQINTVNSTATRLRTQYASVTAKLAPGSARLARVSEINASMTGVLQGVQATSANYTSDAIQLLQKANDATNDASLIISSFSDNPARRAASLALGASLGMLVAGFVGLNLFVATLAGPNGQPPDFPTVLAGWLGVVLTGIVIGLGSGPTHEVVKSLQAYKDSRNGGVGVMTVPTGTDGAGQLFEGLAAIPDRTDRSSGSAVRRVRQSN